MKDGDVEQAFARGRRGRRRQRASIREGGAFPCFVTGWGDSLDAAADMAQADMLAVVRDVLEMPEDHARKYLGIAADLRVCWRGGSRPVMRMELPLAHVSSLARRRLTTALGRRQS